MERVGESAILRFPLFPKLFINIEDMFTRYVKEHQKNGKLSIMEWFMDHEYDLRLIFSS